MAEPTVDNSGKAKFTEDFRSEHQFHPQPDENVPIRQSTLKKNPVKRKSTVETTGSGAESYSSFLYSPIPTSSNPTEALVNRFQGKLAFPSYFNGKGTNKLSSSMAAPPQGLYCILP